MRVLLLVSVLWCGLTLADEPRYYLEPITATAQVEHSDSKSSVAYNVVERVHKVCGTKLTDSETSATARLHLHVLRLKKVGGGSRFLVGVFRGNSVITINERVTDLSGKELSNRTLERKGNWFLGSVTVGGTDNMMLTNMSGLLLQVG